MKRFPTWAGSLDEPSTASLNVSTLKRSDGSIRKGLFHCRQGRLDRCVRIYREPRLPLRVTGR
jgi:hypothetical protein